MGYKARYEKVCEHCGIVRVFEEDKDYGDPYVWCCLVFHFPENEIEIAGVVEKPSLSVIRAVKELLISMGYTKLRVRRSRMRGEKREIEEHKTEYNCRYENNYEI